MEDDKKYELINFTFYLLQDTLQHFMFFFDMSIYNLYN